MATYILLVLKELLTISKGLKMENIKIDGYNIAELTKKILHDDEKKCDYFVELSHFLLEIVSEVTGVNEDTFRVDDASIEHKIHAFRDSLMDVVEQSFINSQPNDLQTIQDAPQGTRINLADECGNVYYWIKSDLDRLVNLTNGHSADYEEIEGYLEQCHIQK